MFPLEFIDLSTYWTALLVMLAMGVATWLYTLRSHDVGIVDSLWSLMFLAAGIIYISDTSAGLGARQILILMMVAVWALRLSIHLTVRNHGKPEDRRYQEIRRNNEPNFAFKSLYIVFGLQAVLAWIISAPLWSSLSQNQSFNGLDMIAIMLWLLGFAFEVISDWQLFRFKANAKNRGKTLDSGLWRYTCHPNYFGEFCIWWAYFLFAVSSGGLWTLYAPLLMSALLLKVSGVGLMEKNITSRRPDYQAYIDKTNTFFPGLPK